MTGRSPEFVRICSVGEVDEGVPVAFSVPDAEDPDRVLVNLEGELFALSGICPHEHADLSQGVVMDRTLWCPIHSSGFDCRTGAVTHPPAETSLRTYRVRTEGDDVYVQISQGT